MNYTYTNFFDKGRFTITDFNCGTLEERLDKEAYYKIIWAREGEVNMMIDGYMMTIKKNQIMFCTPLNKITIEPYTKGVIVYVFNREFYCIRDHDQEVSCNGFLFFGSSLPLIVSLDKKEEKSFQALQVILEEEFETKDHIQGEMLLVLLKRLLIKATRLARKTMIAPALKQEKLDTIRAFNILVEKHFREKHKVSEYASLMNKSPKSLSNLFLKYNDKSPLKVISERICLEAQRLLMYSDKTLSVIAEELGFIDVSHFSKFFKKHTGVSPLKYKKEYKKFITAQRT